jgi:hypothetical protein
VKHLGGEEQEQAEVFSQEEEQLTFNIAIVFFEPIQYCYS